MVRRAFLGGVGVVYLSAFLSLWVQVEGLIGSQGILPVAPFLDLAAERLGESRHHLLPTALWWLPASDTMLELLCGAGVLLSLLLVLGFAPVPTALLLWVDYLSLFTVSRTFLGFQWDILLLEMGFLAIFYAPLGAWSPRSPAWAAPVATPMTWALRLLAFKLMFSSGVVKLSSGDPTWWNLTALAYHYETTCLPTWTGWYMHQLPLWFHRLSTAGMFAIELLLPFFIFIRPLRAVAAAGFTGLMIFIAATGNYGFFNLQALVLCLPLLDDEMLPPNWRRRPAGAGATDDRPARRRLRWPAWLTWPVAIAIAILNLIPLAGAFRLAPPWPAPLVAVYSWQQPFHVVNGYGLFARMTTERPEIVVEGSKDGKTWQAYDFRWKPGDPNERPGFVQPHMPRLDWRMWFAALGSARGEGWFYPFCARILEGSPPVLGLLARDPFADAPPRFLRAQLYDYRFTRRGESGDAWWKRRFLRPYTPVLTLDAEGNLTVANDER